MGRSRYCSKEHYPVQVAPWRESSAWWNAFSVCRQSHSGSAGMSIVLHSLHEVFTKLIITSLLMPRGPLLMGTEEGK